MFAIGYFRRQTVSGKNVEFLSRNPAAATRRFSSGLIVAARRGQVRAAIKNILSSIPDYSDELQSIVETTTPKDSAGQPVNSAAYLRVMRNKVATFKDPATGTIFNVPGVIVVVRQVVLRTEGVIAEAVMGQGDALDSYAAGLQAAAVTERELRNKRLAAALERDKPALSTIENDDSGAAGPFLLFLEMLIPSG